MENNKSKMTCPQCGDAMNHHADKLIYSSEQLRPTAVDPALGGVVAETHNCPSCGAIATLIVE